MDFSYSQYSTFIAGDDAHLAVPWNDAKEKEHHERMRLGLDKLCPNSKNLYKEVLTLITPWDSFHAQFKNISGCLENAGLKITKDNCKGFLPIVDNFANKLCEQDIENWHKQNSHNTTSKRILRTHACIKNYFTNVVDIKSKKLTLDSEDNVAANINSSTGAKSASGLNSSKANENPIHAHTKKDDTASVCGVCFQGQFFSFNHLIIFFFFFRIVFLDEYLFFYIFFFSLPTINLLRHMSMFSSQSQ